MGSCLLACCIVGTNVRTQHGCVCLVEPQDVDVGAIASAASTAAASCQPELSEDWDSMFVSFGHMSLLSS